MEADDVLMSEVQESMDALMDSVVDLEVNDENYFNPSRKRKGSTPPAEHHSGLKRQKSDDGEQSSDSDLIILEKANGLTSNYQNPSPSGCAEVVNYVSSDTDDDGDNDHVDGQPTVQHSNDANEDDGNEVELIPTPVLHTVSDGEDGDEDVIFISDDNNSPLDDHHRRQPDVVDLASNPVEEWPNGVVDESAALITACSHVVDEEVAVIQAAQSVNSHYRGGDSVASAPGSRYNDASGSTALSPSASRCSRSIFTRQHDGASASSSFLPPPSLLPRTTAPAGIHHHRQLHPQRPSSSSFAPSRHLNEIRRVICDPHAVTADELEAMGQPTRQSTYALDPLTNMRFYEPHYRYKAGGGPLNTDDEVYCLSKVTQIGERICSVENKFSELVDLVSQFLKSQNGRSTAKKSVKRKKLAAAEETALRKAAELEAERQKQAAAERQRRAERRRRSSELGEHGTVLSTEDPQSPTTSQMADEPMEAEGEASKSIMNDKDDGATKPNDDVCDVEREVENAELVFCGTADGERDDNATRSSPTDIVVTVHNDSPSFAKETLSVAASEHN